MQFRKPPVWEVGLSAVTGLPGVVNSFDVKGLHDLFRSEYPHVERQPPVGGIEGVASTGLEESVGVPPRWWFTSLDESTIVQAQEQFLAVNWRRVVPAGQRSEYPGFDKIVARKREAVSRVESYCRSVGYEMPQPVACELMYDNIVPLVGEDGSAITISDILAEYEPSPAGPKVAWQMSWQEPLVPGAPLTDPFCRVLIVLGAMPETESGGLLNVLKINLTFRAQKLSWDEVFSFFDEAHGRARKRFVDLTTDGARAMWGEQ